jgi:alpha-galactosidase
MQVKRSTLLICAALAAAALLHAQSAPPIAFYADRGVFVIQTENTTYAIERSPSGAVNHTYWGSRIDRAADLPVGQEGRTARRTQVAYEREHFRQEYVGWGGYTYDEPALKASFADGSRVLALIYKSHAIESGAGSHTLRVTLADSHYPIEAVLCYRVYKGLDLVDRWAEVINRGDAPITLESAQSATWYVPRGEKYRLTHLSGDWGREYRIEHVELTQAALRLGSRTGLSGPFAVPFFALDREGRATEDDGAVWFGSLQWSGNWKIVVEKNNYSQVRVTGGVEDFDFAWRLKPGQSFTTPVFTGGFTAQGFGAMSRMLHRYQRDWLMRPNKAHQPLPVIYNSWFAINGQKMLPEPKLLVDIARRAAQIGVELFVMDGGWQKDFGDWTPDPRRFPDGLKPMVEEIHKMGMKFGIWVEFENVRAESDLYKAHPDWAVHSPHHPQMPDGRQRLVLNLAREDVRDHLLAAMDRLIRENSIDYLKLDMNRFFSEPDWPEVDAAERREFWVRYVRNLYFIFEKLQERFPRVIFENCASGGARVDLAMTKIFERVNRSDNQDPLDMPGLHEGYTYVFLPGAAGGGGHIGPSPNFVNQRATPLRYRAHTGMLGSLAVSLRLDQSPSEELAELKKYVAFYKEIRNLVWNGDLYRLRSASAESHSAFEYVSPDQAEAVLLVLGKNIQRYGQDYPEAPRLRLAGLRPEWLYRVDGGAPISGQALMNAGVALRLVGDYDSRALRIRRAAQ